GVGISACQDSAPPPLQFNPGCQPSREVEAEESAHQDPTDAESRPRLPFGCDFIAPRAKNSEPPEVYKPLPPRTCHPGVEPLERSEDLVHNTPRFPQGPADYIPGVIIQATWRRRFVECPVPNASKTRNQRRKFTR